MLLLYLRIILFSVSDYRNTDPEYMTGSQGLWITFNCFTAHPDDEAASLGVQLEKRWNNMPIFIQDDNHTHCDDAFIDYKTNICRIAKVDPDYRKRPSIKETRLVLTNIKESDWGWYNCKVILPNRQTEKEENQQPVRLNPHLEIYDNFHSN